MKNFHFETRFISQKAAATASCERDMSRRAFIARSGTTLAGLVLANGCSTLPPAGLDQPAFVGSQLYGWGQYYEREGKKLSDHLNEVLSAVRDCGYDYAETYLDTLHLEKNAEFAHRCQTKGLRAVSLYTGGRLHEEGRADEVVARVLESARVCHDLGFKVINCNPDPIGREKTDQELTTQVKALRQLGAGLNQLGMRLGIHHHSPEMRNRARDFHYNFQNTEPGVVGFCYDVHWVFKGGLEPKTVLPLYGDRVVSWHLRQSRGGVWWEDLDQGDIDYAVVAHLVRQNRWARLFAVELALEQDTKITRSVVENHRRSRDFVRTVFGV